MKKKILIISIFYPPIQSIASNRIASFTKYLNKDKFNIDVVTLLENNSKEFEKNENIQIHRLEDKSYIRAFKFEKRTNKIVHITKLICNKILRTIFDEYDGWKNKAVSKVFELMKSKKYDLVLSTYAPSVTHNVALELKKRYPDIKWIADMRDEMSLNPFLPQKEQAKLVNLEKEIFKYCDALTSVSKPIVDDFKKLSNSDTIKFVEIRNGYDFEIKNLKSNNKIFTISYIGSFYGVRNPRNFLLALSKLVEKGLITTIKINFVGVVKPFYIQDNLKEFINIYDKILHTEAISYMNNSDCLLLIHPTTSRKGVYTGKLFEYLATLKPIIALVDKSDVAAKLIEKANAGYISDNDDIQQIEKIILKAYNNWKQGLACDFNLDVIKQHHRSKQAKRLELLIEELI
ncbi:hypothetical protein [Sulfurimonas sp.]|uniref:hypothetical protein n=1 Tax=Sulfurimonas sp. TaxID=2022749 RepID=UPI0025CD5A26|nr:hypothetical protein [Sulfurimonas sp.]MCK9472255.1 hypothetical protein [Sulfurimonas sp.]